MPMELLNIITLHHATVNGKKHDFTMCGFQQIHSEIMIEALQKFVDEKHKAMKALTTKKKISPSDQEQINELINQYTNAQVLIKSLEDSKQV